MKRYPMLTSLLTAALTLVACSPILWSQNRSDLDAGQRSPDVPRTISYQGMLTSSGGTPFSDGRYDVSVTLYADADGQHPVWSGSYETAVIGGLFNLYLGGEDNPLPKAEQLSTPLWIGTSVNGEPELLPRSPLTAAPYALNVPNRAITGDKLADKSVTAQKVDMDYLAGLRINGELITGAGTVLNLNSTDDIALSYDRTSQSLMIEDARAQKARAAGDDEKGTDALGTTNDFWTMRGNGRTDNGGVVVPVAGDWIGTSNGVSFDMRAAGLTTLQLQPSTGVGAVSIVGGNGNIIAGGADASVIGGGGGTTPNSITGSAVKDVIAGGGNNNIYDSDYDFIGGGLNNTIDQGNYNVIGGGQINIIQPGSQNSLIAGGIQNTLRGSLSTIGGGGGNIVSADEATIAGGHRNQVYSYVATVAGGHNNYILTSNSQGSFIGGGYTNVIDMTMSAGIGSGQNNRIRNNSTVSFIGAGEGNLIEDAPFASLGGGQENKIVASHGTIPGGDKLSTTASYAQTAVGFMNAPRGSMTVRPGSAVIAGSDDPLFMVGNGDVNAGATSNAFEVSYNGHSTVYGTNGGGGVAAIEGATYVDNIIYAWGDIPAGLGGPIYEFGVGGIGLAGPGVYDITLNITDPLGNPITLNEASITATIVETPDGDYGCTSISTTKIGAIGANSFRVRTYLVNGGCEPADLPFMFKVTGRQ